MQQKDVENTRVFNLLFERPKEPTFKPKGDTGSIFEVPNENFLTDRFKPLQNEIGSRFKGEIKERIKIKNIRLPDISEPMELTRYENFSLFIPKHRSLAGRLISIFLGMRTVDDLKSMAVYARDRINPYMFNYCLSVALLHRPDTKNVDVPSFVSSFPDKFVDAIVLQKAKEDLSILPNGTRDPIIIPRDYTASDFEPEHRIAYFREDLGVNLHHWHWHLVYPFQGPINVVKKDRRGELFYYMHQQLIARYNVERLCNKMSRVERLLDWHQPILEGYFPKLDSMVSSRAWPARGTNSKMSNINRETDQIKYDIDDLERWRDRIYAAIHSGFITLPNGQKQQLGESNGIDILGNILEASDLTPNKNFYGDLHNMGHVFLALIHDPDGRHLETFGVMGDVATAMRDPVFYRWHSFVDNIFQEYKSTLPPYQAPQLSYQGVIVESASINVSGGQRNQLQTFWQQSDVDLSRGMDFTPRGSVFARFTHLQHQPFTYNIRINNQGPQRRGTCRIYLGPKLDERGLPWLFRDQRTLMIEMDTFIVNLNQGTNNINRRSDESSVTIPFNRTFRDLDANRPAVGSDALAQFNFCGCGWPQHMLVSKGTEEGFPCQLFVMISDYENDKIEQSMEGQCNDAYSFCGLKDKLYPDRRAMGFPFDRNPRNGVDNLQQFLFPNMRLEDVVIKFSEKTVVGQGYN